jgi:hypothetical protein
MQSFVLIDKAGDDKLVFCSKCPALAHPETFVGGSENG